MPAGAALAVYPSFLETTFVVAADVVLAGELCAANAAATRATVKAAAMCRRERVHTNDLRIAFPFRSWRPGIRPLLVDQRGERAWRRRGHNRCGCLGGVFARLDPLSTRVYA